MKVKNFTRGEISIKWLLATFLFMVALSGAVWFALRLDFSIGEPVKPVLSRKEKPLDAKVKKAEKPAQQEEMQEPKVYPPIKLSAPQDVIGFMKVASLEELEERIKGLSDGSGLEIGMTDILAWLSSFIENPSFEGINPSAEMYAVFFNPEKCSPMGAVILPLVDLEAFLGSLVMAIGEVRQAGKDLYALTIEYKGKKYDRYFVRVIEGFAVCATRREQVDSIANWAGIQKAFDAVPRKQQAVVHIKTRKLYEIYKDRLSKFTAEARKRTKFLEKENMKGEMKFADEFSDWVVDSFAAFLSQSETVDFHAGFDRRGITLSFEIKARQGTRLAGLLSENSGAGSASLMQYLPKDTFFGGTFTTGKKSGETVMRTFSQLLKIFSPYGEKTAISLLHENLAPLFEGGKDGGEVAFGLIGPKEIDVFALTYVQVFKVGDAEAALKQIKNYVEKVGCLPLLGNTSAPEFVANITVHDKVQIHAIRDSKFDFRNIPGDDQKMIYNLVFGGEEPAYHIAAVDDKVLVAMGTDSLGRLTDMIDCVKNSGKGFASSRRYEIATEMLPVRRSSAVCYIAPTEFLRLFFLFTSNMFSKDDDFNSVINMPHIPWPNSGIGVTIRNAGNSMGEMKVYVPAEQLKEFKQVRNALKNKDELPVE